MLWGPLDTQYLAFFFLVTSLLIFRILYFLFPPLWYDLPLPFASIPLVPLFPFPSLLSLTFHLSCFFSALFQTLIPFLFLPFSDLLAEPRRA